MVKALIALSLLAGTSAKAQVVFLDLNFATDEVKAAREQAKARGETFILIPDTSTLPKAEYDRLVQVKKEYSKIRAQSLALMDHGRGSVLQRMNSKEANVLYKQMEKLEAEFKKYKLADKDIYKLMTDKGIGAKTLVISGHSEGVRYDGVLGTIDRESLVEATDKSGISKTVKSIYLWGCYGGSGGALGSWKDAIPGAEYLIGYSTRSDLAESDDGPEKMSRAMAAEFKMRSECDKNNALSILEKANGKGGNRFLAGLVNDNYLCSRRHYAGTLAELKEDCPDLLRSVSNEKEYLYEPYADGKKPMPPDTDKSPLRKIYQKVQDASQCLIDCQGDKKIDLEKFMKETKLSEEEIGSSEMIPCPNAVLGLIKFEHVVSNYKRRYKDEFEFYKKVLANEDGVSPDCRKILTGDFEATDRALISNTVNQRCLDDSKFKNEKIRDVASKTVSRAWGLLNDISVPLSWVDEQATPEVPKGNGWVLTDDNAIPITEMPPEEKKNN